MSSPAPAPPLPTTNKTASSPEDGLTLRQIASQCCKPIDIGTAVLPKPLFGDADDDDDDDDDDETTKETRYAKTVADEFNAIVIEHHLKWTPLCETIPGPNSDGTPSDRIGRYDFHHCDRLVDWAQRRNMKVKGHVLIWHVTTPSFVSRLSPPDLREAMRRHIHTVMGHFRDRIRIWDVVNEALAPDGSFARNVFYEKLGPKYVEDAFRFAHEADPKAFLIYNDNKVEGMYGPNAKKAEGFYHLLRDLRRKGVPVHGAGMQAHFDAGGVGRHRPPTPKAVKDQIRRLGELGLKVNISEMDVRVRKLPFQLRSMAQRQIYRDIIAAALSEPAFDGVWIWGFTDKHTWVTDFYQEDEPLLFDEEYVRKDCYYGLRDAIGTLTVGGTVGGEVLVKKDVDEDGNGWGHLWMQPEPQGETQKSVVDSSGDSRPDWLQGD